MRAEGHMVKKQLELAGIRRAKARRSTIQRRRSRCASVRNPRREGPMEQRADE
jgi:hypothetical protein